MTRTALDYKPRHKKPDGWAGSTPKGPHRWARAAANAMTRPNSDDAKLYRARVNNAGWYADTYSTDAKRPMEFHHDNKRSYSVCGIYCAVMQAQLEYATLDREDLDAVFLGNWSKTYTRIFRGEERVWVHEQSIFVRYLDRVTLKTEPHCQCCGTKIKRSKR